MKAAVLRQGRLLVENVDEPRPAEGEVLVAVKACGICGSDLHLVDGYVPTMEAGDILGHEFMGEVVEIGRGNTSLQVGQKVVVCDHERASPTSSLVLRDAPAEHGSALEVMDALLDGGFEPGRMYEVTYVATGARLVGAGLAAIRDADLILVLREGTIKQSMLTLSEPVAAETVGTLNARLNALLEGATADEVEARLDRLGPAGGGEGPSEERLARRVGERVMTKLHELDDVAYVRFASVYREFKDVNDFLAELKNLLSQQ